MNNEVAYKTIEEFCLTYPSIAVVIGVALIFATIALISSRRNK